MSLKNQLTDDMKTAMKAGEKERLGVIRLINAAIKQREVDERIELDDAQVLAVLEKMVKQRRDSVVAVRRRRPRGPGAASSATRSAIIEHYLPATHVGGGDRGRRSTARSATAAPPARPTWAS